MGDADQTGQDPEAGADPDELFQSREDGQLHFIKETEASTFPVTAPADATPLEEDEPEGIIPPSPLWAMKERRHEQWPHLFGHPDRIRACIGSGDAAVYAIDDGKHHCMIGRRVGATVDGCTYSLVARITKDTYQSLASGAIDGRQAFLAGADAGLSGTVDAAGDGQRLRRRLLRRPRRHPRPSTCPRAPSSNSPRTCRPPTAERQRPAPASPEGPGQLLAGDLARPDGAEPAVGPGGQQRCATRWPARCGPGTRRTGGPRPRPSPPGPRARGPG